MSLLREHLGTCAHWTRDREQDTPARFFHGRDEAVALTQGSALLDLTHLALVAVNGEQRVEFLSGLITNQIRKVRPDQTIYAALLSPQGRYLWDFTLIEDAGTFHLVTDPDRVDALAGRLAMYLLRTRAGVTRDAGSRGVLGLVGPGAAATLAKTLELPLPEAPPLGWSIPLPGGGVLWQDPRHAAFGWRLSAPREQLPLLWDRLAATAVPCGLEAWEYYRMAHALPRGGAELQPDVTLPLEAGLVDLHAIDFTKGCYVGQETTARTHHRGTVKKHLYRLTFAGPSLPAPGTPVLRGEREAGSVSSVAAGQDRLLGLAILRDGDVADAAEPLTVAGQPVQVQRPAWATWADNPSPP
ncbi:MAG: hypothetical protein H7831_01510 [Magnetococcus sp. WYHC-3]